MSRRRRYVYSVITPSRIHTYGSWKRREDVMIRLGRLFKLPPSKYTARWGAIDPQRPDFEWPETYQFVSSELR